MDLFEYQKTRRYFAQCHQGFEDIVAEELESLGAQKIQPGFRGIYFSAERAVLYSVVYHSRLIIRVLAPLFSFACRDRDDLYKAGRSLEWDTLFSHRNTFAVFANVSGNEHLRHSQFAAQCLKDAVADYFRGRFGKRPNVDREHPDVRLSLYIENTMAVISLDASGSAVHRRGYRQQNVKAPMGETLAAAMVALSSWNGEKPLYDPMCGSGTLLCEALMSYCKIPSGYLKKDFGFRFLPDFKKDIWDEIRAASESGLRNPVPGLISGSDMDPAAFDAALANCSRLPGGDIIRLSRKDFRDIPSLENHVILVNPPYGIRISPEDHLDELYKDFGDFLKNRCKGSEVYIFFGNREMIKKIGLRPSWKKPMKNAGLDGRVVRYDLY
jgi:putative N6-adenine-specific DNA methylase